MTLLLALGACIAAIAVVAIIAIRLLLKKEVKRTDFKNQEHYSFPSQPRKLGKNTKARKR